MADAMQGGRAPAAGGSARRDVTLNLRVTAEMRDLIDRAATTLGKSRSEFILESARTHAEDVLLDRTLFALDDARYDAFLRVLDDPAPPNERLRALMRRKAP